MNPQSGIDTLLALLDELSDCPPTERPAVERRICEAFETDRAVLALDMSAYSFSVRRGGVLPHLCRIRRMQSVCSPLIVRHRGQVVRQIADNILAVFKTSAEAIQAAIAINEAVASKHGSLEDDRLCPVAIGIDCGKLLLVPEYDCFGDAVNIAFKLGEDVARAGEILITENARAQAGDAGAFPLEELQISVSGLEVHAYKVVYGAAAI